MRHAILVIALLVPAQAAEISGRVQFSPEIALDHAQIALVNQATGVRLVAYTNSEGYYSISHAQPGVFKLQVRKEGFKTAVRMDIKLDIDELARIDFTMHLGAMSDSITVEADPSLLDLEDASLRTVVRRDFLDNLPVSGRGLLTLLELAGGVVQTPASDTYGAGQFSVNGQRADANYITVDGLSVNGGIPAPFGFQGTRQSPGGTLPPYTAIGSLHGIVSMEALDEFRFDTATPRTELGRMPGGQLSLSTRSGTNQFHGTVFEYFRDGILGANNWFANAGGLARPPLRFHDFGGVLGGPLVPNRTFFFVSLEILRLRQSVSETGVTPSAALRSQAVPALQPFLAVPFPSAADPSTGAGPFSDLAPEWSSVRAMSLRIDHTITSHLQLFGRYNRAPSSNTTAGYGGTQRSRLDVSTDTLTAGADAGGSRTQASFRLGYLLSAQENAVTPAGAAAQADPGYASIAHTPPAGTSYWAQVPNTSVSIENWRARYTQHQWNLTGSVSTSWRSHHAGFGADYRQVSPDMKTQPYLIYTFYQSLDSFLAGRPSLLTVAAYQPARIRLHNFSIFADDAWKVSGRLTLSYGLRLESNPPPGALDRRPLFAAFSPGPPESVRTSADGGSLWKDGYRHLAPRAGIALRPSARGNLVLRGGLGAFYDVGFGTAIKASPLLASSRLLEFPPFGPPDPYAEINLAVAPVQFIAQDFQTPVTLRWNATVEQLFSKRLIASLSYVGASGFHLIRMENTPAAHYLASHGSSQYHSLQAQARVHLDGGLQAMLSLAWSHSIDTASTEDYQPFAQASGPSYPYAALPIDRGNSDFDVRLSGTVAFLYQPKRLHGWSVDGMLRARTGFPVDLQTSILTRPDLVPGQPAWIPDAVSGTGRRLNPAAFALPAAGAQGTVGRNVLFGPGMWQLDLVVQREFRLPDRAVLQFRAEAFNALNHPNFGRLDTVFTSQSLPEFGRPVTTLNQFLGTGGPAYGLAPALQIGGPRSMQIALRLRF